jgi:hypothetical protein
LHFIGGAKLKASESRPFYTKRYLSSPSLALIMMHRRGLAHADGHVNMRTDECSSRR